MGVHDRPEYALLKCDRPVIPVSLDIGVGQPTLSSTRIVEDILRVKLVIALL